MPGNSTDPAAIEAEIARLRLLALDALRRLNGRSLSGNAVSSQLDFAWRMRNSVFMAVCIENLIRFDCVTESYNVGDDGCAPVLLSGSVDLTIQVEEPA
jgi:hypothetical protein